MSFCLSVFLSVCLTDCLSVWLVGLSCLPVCWWITTRVMVALYLLWLPCDRRRCPPRKRLKPSHSRGTTHAVSTNSVDALIEHVEGTGLTTKYILETHAHADHLSAAPYVKDRLGGQIGIGRRITEVQVGSCCGLGGFYC